MSETAGPKGSSGGTFLVLVAWLIAAVALVWVRWSTLVVDGPLAADSIMRLVQVRDFLAGQGWYDTVQHRLGAPDGTPLPWSRLIDAPLAGLILLFDHVSSSRWIAEMLTASVWPLMLLLMLMMASASIASALAGRAAALLAALLALQSGPAVVHYLPGAIDHRNAQIALCLVFAACILRADRSSVAGLGAGLAGGLALAVGAGTLPVIAAGTVILALAWLFEPARFSPFARSYGVAFAVTTLACLIMTVAPARWLDPTCDAGSGAHAALAAAGGFGLAIFATILGSRANLLHRIIALAGLGAICAALVLIAFPDCLAGPLAAIDPDIRAIWYDRLPGIQSLRLLFDTDFATAVAYAAVPLIGLLAAMWFLSATDDAHRYRWAAAALFAGVSLLTMILQTGAADIAGALAAPIVACLAVRLATRPAGDGTRVSIPILLVVLPFVSYLAWHALGTKVLRPLAPRFGLAGAELQVAVAKDCLERSAYSELAALKPTVILSHTGLAPAILAYTPHEAIGGDYPRGVAGILETYQAFSSSGAAPTDVIARRGVGLVVVCHDGTDGKVGDPALVNGLLGRLKRGDVPDWLEPVFVGDRLLAYLVKMP